MQIKQTYRIIHIANNHVLVPSGNNSDLPNGVVALNEASAFLLNHMKENVSENDLVEALIDEYDIDAETAARDVRDMVHKLFDMGLIEK